jgi:hypothetical protein
MPFRGMEPMHRFVAMPAAWFSSETPGSPVERLILQKNESTATDPVGSYNPKLLQEVSIP